MEILGGRGAVDRLYVVAGAQYQKALDARARVLRALALEAVRQQQHQAAGLAPFRFGAGDELVDHDLRAVDEIAELRLPHHQRERIGHAIAELEAQHGVLAQRAVEDVEAGLVRRDMLQRSIFLAVFGIPEGQVPLAEGAAPGILPAEPHGRSFERQGAEGQRLAEGPVDGAAFLDDAAAAFNETAQLGMQMEILGELRERRG